MTIIARKAGRGRVKLQKSVNVNPRNGLTLRMLIKANIQVRLPLAHVGTLNILSTSQGVARSKSGKHDCIKFKIKDSVRTTPRDPIKRHDVLVRFKDTQQKTKGLALSGKNVNVVVSCSCEFFMYMCEYALTHFSASFIKYSNGQPPLQTNPSLIPFTCKHLHLALMQIAKKGW